MPYSRFVFCLYLFRYPPVTPPTDVSASKVSSYKLTKAAKPPNQRAGKLILRGIGYDTSSNDAFHMIHSSNSSLTYLFCFSYLLPQHTVKQPTKMRSKKHMLGRLVLLSGACASAAAENVVGSTKSIEKKNRLGSSSSRRVRHGLNEEDDVQADEDPSSFTVFQRMKQEGVHQDDVSRHMHAPVASHDVGVLSSKGDEDEVDTLEHRRHRRRRRRRRAKMNTSHLPRDVGVSTNGGGYDKVEEDVHYAKMEEVRALFLFVG
jgi:hypothetical protein